MKTIDLITSAQKMWDARLSAIPFKVDSKGKVTGPRDWTQYCDNPPSESAQLEFARMLSGNFNALQIACGRVFDNRRLVCIDVDDDRLVRLVEVVIGTIICGRFGSKGAGIFVWVEASDEFFKTKKQIKLADGSLGIELLTRSFGSFVPPSLHRKTGKPYKWIGEPIWECLEKIPMVSRDQWQLIDAAASSEHSIPLLEGLDTHDPMVRLCQSLVRHTDDDALLAKLIQSLFASNYQGDNNTDREVLRSLSWAREHGFETRGEPYPEDTINKLQKFSERFCVVNLGGKVLVLEKSHNVELNRDLYVFWQPTDLRNYFLDEPVMVPSKGRVVAKGIGEVWFGWMDRPKAESVNLLPDQPPGLITLKGRSIYNLWNGFGIEAAEGDWSILEYHLKNVICAGDDRCFKYLEGWLANAIQRPHMQGEVAVVMRGGRGTGKGTVGRMLARIFGQHYFHTASQGQVAGRFNSHLRDTVLLFADEAFFAGDKRHESVLKALITEDFLAIEEKFVNVVQTRNRIHLVMATNEDWAVPSGVDERRFFVVQVSDKHKQDEEYFARVNSAIRGPELAAMLHHLLNLDLSEFSVRQVPQTEALMEQKQYSLDSVLDWLHMLLDEGQFHYSSGWPDYVETQELYADYVKYTQNKRGRPISDNIFSKRIQNVIGAKAVRRNGGIASRSRCLEFASLELSREHFDNHLGFKTDWSEVDPEEQNQSLPNF